MNKKYYIETYGCQMNVYDSELVGSLLNKSGYYATKNIKVGTRIIQYKGKIITNSEVERNSKYDNDKDIYLLSI